MDSEGLLLTCHVHAANIQERAGAKLLLAKRGLGFSRRRLRLVWLDNGYWDAPFAAWVKARWPRVKVVALCRNATLPNRRVPGGPSFVRLSRRRVIERTFAWLGRWRRTARTTSRTLAPAKLGSTSP